MNTISARRQQIADSLRDKEYRDLYVAANIRNRIAFQIKAMREDRNLTQGELGERAGMAQERVSQLEDPNYGRLTLKTLLRMASAFDVSLVVGFEPFSSLVDWGARLSLAALAVPSFEEDSQRLEAEVGVPLRSSTDSIAHKFRGETGYIYISADRSVQPRPPILDDTNRKLKLLAVAV